MHLMNLLYFVFTFLAIDILYSFIYGPAFFTLKVIFDEYSWAFHFEMLLAMFQFWYIVMNPDVMEK